MNFVLTFFGILLCPIISFAQNPTNSLDFRVHIHSFHEEILFDKDTRIGKRHHLQGADGDWTAMAQIDASGKAAHQANIALYEEKAAISLATDWNTEAPKAKSRLKILVYPKKEETALSLENAMLVEVEICYSSLYNSTNAASPFYQLIPRLDCALSFIAGHKWMVSVNREMEMKIDLAKMSEKDWLGK